MVWNAHVGFLPCIAILQQVVVTKVDGLSRTKRIVKKKGSSQAAGQRSQASPIACRYEDLSELVDQECPPTIAAKMPFDVRDGVGQRNGRGALERAAGPNRTVGLP